MITADNYLTWEIENLMTSTEGCVYFIASVVSAGKRTAIGDHQMNSRPYIRHQRASYTVGK